jgi:sec-independent protein translocase protein TatB
MFDVGWTEMVLIAVVAIIVIGPKDLPVVLRTMGRWAGKARALAREFQDSMNEVIRESELEELKSEIDNAKRLTTLEAEPPKTPPASAPAAPKDPP